MQKISRISNFILIITFLAIITIPQILFAVFKENIPIDTSENRKLAEKPELTIETIKTYPNDFEKYYNDHLPFRSIIRNAWTTFNFFLLDESINNKILVGKNEGTKSSTWLFYQDDTDGNPVKEAQGLANFSEIQINEIMNKIKTSTAENEKLNIKTYFAIIPNKENIYKEKLPEKIEIYDKETRVDKLVKYLQNECNINNIIYPKDVFDEVKKNKQIYYKQDSHWNSYGAFIGFKEILSRIESTYNNFEHNVEVSEEEILHRDLTNIIGIKNIFKDQVTHVEFLKDKTYTSEIHNENIEITTCENAEIQKTVLIVGDSCMVDLKPYFSKVYSTVIYVHRLKYGKYILYTYKPDIFICETIERYVDIIPQIEL